MRAVNLLPREVEQRRRRVHVPLVVVCAGTAVAVAAVAGGYLHERSAASAGAAQVAALDAQIAAVPAPVRPPATLSALGQEKQQRIAALAAALAQRVAWDRILREVSLVLPDDVWLQSLNATAPAGAATGAVPAATPAPPTGFTIVGFTYSQASVARLLSRLDVVPDLQDVTLQSSTRQEIGNRPVVSFSIAGNVRGPGASS